MGAVEHTMVVGSIRIHSNGFKNGGDINSPVCFLCIYQRMLRVRNIQLIMNGL